MNKTIGESPKKVNLIISKMEKREVYLYLKMEQGIKDNGKDKTGMDMDNNNGLMVLSTKDSGKIIKLMDKELSGTYMETNMRANGKEIKHTVLESILI